MSPVWVSVLSPTVWRRRWPSASSDRDAADEVTSRIRWIARNRSGRCGRWPSALPRIVAKGDVPSPASSRVGQNPVNGAVLARYLSYGGSRTRRVGGHTGYARSPPAGLVPVRARRDKSGARRPTAALITPRCRPLEERRGSSACGSPGREAGRVRTVCQPDRHPPSPPAPALQLSPVALVGTGRRL